MKKMLGLICVLLLTGVSFSQTWDLDLDFESATVNPNGAWSYGYIEDDEFQLYGEGLFQIEAERYFFTWRYPGTYDFGVTQKLVEGEEDIEAWDSYRYGGEMTSGPGGQGRTAVRWTCPAAGDYAISSIWQGFSTKSGGTTVDVTLELNGEVIFADNVAGFIGRPGEDSSGAKPQVSTMKVLTLSAGDTLDQTIHGGIDGIHADCTNHDLTITRLTTQTPVMNLVMKLDAGTGVTDALGSPITTGQAVGVWEDQAGSLDAKAAWGDATLESGVFPNGQHNVIRFTGEDGLVIYDLSDPENLPGGYDPYDPNSKGPLDLETYTLYVVGKLNQETSYSQVFFGNYHKFNGYMLGVSDVFPDRVKFWTTTSGEMRSSNAIGDTDRYYLLTATVDNAYTGRLFVNDCAEDETVARSTYTNATVVSVGALGNGSQFLKGDIAEIRVYNGFAESTHLTVVNELVNKYGLDRSCLMSTDPDVTALSGLTLYGTTDQGALVSNRQWNTYYPDDAWELTLTNKTIAELQALDLEPNDVFPYALNADSNMMIFENLTKGQTYTYTWLCATPFTGEDAYYGMNFYFEGAQSLGGKPGISVFANMTAAGETDEPFQANGNSTTMGWPYPAITPGAGTVIYKNFEKGLSVTVTDWVFYHQNVHSLDLVRPYVSGAANGPDGTLDVVGQFTVRVDPYSPTCEDLIALGGEYLAMDLDKNCYVNLADFAMFASWWLECNDPENAGCTPVAP